MKAGALALSVGSEIFACAAAVERGDELRKSQAAGTNSRTSTLNSTQYRAATLRTVLRLENACSSNPRQRAVVAGGGGGGSVSVGVDVVAFVLERVPSVGRAKPRT